MIKTIISVVILFCVATLVQAEYAAAGECTRETIQAAIDSYLEAQKAGGPKHGLLTK